MCIFAASFILCYLKMNQLLSFENFVNIPSGKISTGEVMDQRLDTAHSFKRHCQIFISINIPATAQKDANFLTLILVLSTFLIFNLFTSLSEASVMECQEDNTFCRAFSQLTMRGSALTSAERFQMSSKSFLNYTDKVYIFMQNKTQAQEDKWLIQYHTDAQRSRLYSSLGCVWRFGEVRYLS